MPQGPPPSALPEEPPPPLLPQGPPRPPLSERPPLPLPPHGSPPFCRPRSRSRRRSSWRRWWLPGSGPELGWAGSDDVADQIAARRRAHAGGPSGNPASQAVPARVAQALPVDALPGLGADPGGDPSRPRAALAVEAGGGQRDRGGGPWVGRWRSWISS